MKFSDPDSQTTRRAYSAFIRSANILKHLPKISSRLLWVCFGLFLLLCAPRTAFSLTFAEVLDCSNVVWTAVGNINPIGITNNPSVCHDGVDCMQTSNVNDNEFSGVHGDVIGPGTVTFWWNVNAEIGDFFI